MDDKFEELHKEKNIQTKFFDEKLEFLEEQMKAHPENQNLIDSHYAVSCKKSEWLESWMKRACDYHGITKALQEAEEEIRKHEEEN